MIALPLTWEILNCVIVPYDNLLICRLKAHSKVSTAMDVVCCVQRPCIDRPAAQSTVCLSWLGKI
jgi:hypothetical protein